MVELDEKLSTYYLIFLYLGLFFICYHQTDGGHPNKKRGKTTTANANVFTALPMTGKAPRTNPSSTAKVELGRLLFYNPILSSDQVVVFATYNHPNNGYAEYRNLSIEVNGHGLDSKRFFNEPNGIPFVKRNAHTILNTAFSGISPFNQYVPENASMFWDMRVLNLENQTLESIKCGAATIGHSEPKERI